MTDAPVNIGFIGLGIMGAPMAGHLLNAGHRLFVHTRTPAKAQQLLNRGATWGVSPQIIGEQASIVFTIVTDTPDVEHVLFGPSGLAHTLAAGSIVVDMSTISPTRTREFAETLAQRDITLLDAPVTGGEIGAKNATLTIMVGGDRAALDRVTPLLSIMGKKIVHVGPSGSGQTLKACNQILCAVNMIGVCEALSLAKQSGLDLAAAIDTLGGGAGGSWAWTTLGGKVVSGDLNPAFMIKLMQKDLRIVQDAAEDLHTFLPGTALAQQLFRRVEAIEGGENLGTQAMIRAYEGPPGK